MCRPHPRVNTVPVHGGCGLCWMEGWRHSVLPSVAMRACQGLGPEWALPPCLVQAVPRLSRAAAWGLMLCEDRERRDWRGSRGGCRTLPRSSCTAPQTLNRVHGDPLKEQAGRGPCLIPQVQPLKPRQGAARAHPAEQV